jgi:serine protease Do
MMASRRTEDPPAIQPAIEEDPMDRMRRISRWVLPAGALAGLIALGAFSVPPAFTRASKPLWTEKGPAAPTVAQVASPNWVEIARTVKPAVVNVSVKRAEPAMPRAPGGPRGERDLDEFFKRFFGDRPRHEARGLGSGFIIHPDGHIVTNNHVVENAAEVTVKLADGRELPAKVVGRDAKTDLALLKVETTGLPTIPFGDSSALQVGEPVMAIGNPFGLEQTVTTGIVSATARVIGAGPYDDFIQTDASINPGNSGGPLLDGRGQVVGINTAIFSRSGGSDGIGFAIPVNLAKTVITQLTEHGRVIRAQLGVNIQPVTEALAKGMGLPDQKGALVAAVVEGSPAMKAGIKAGDVIVEYDSKPIAKSEDLPRAVAGTAVGRDVPVKVLRDGKLLTLQATVARMDEPETRASVEPTGKGRLGLSVEPMKAEEARALGLSGKTGVVVRNVQPDGKAADAGIQPGDVILEANRKPVTSVDELRRIVEQQREGTPIVLLVRRENASLYVAVQS